LFGKPLIVLVAADAVGVTFHIQPQTRMPGDDAGHLGQFLARQRPQRELGRVEKDIRHVHDQATRRVAGLQNGVELRQQLSAQFRLSASAAPFCLGRAIQFRLGAGPLRVVLAFQTIGFVLRRRHLRIAVPFQPVRFGLGSGHPGVVLVFSGPLRPGRQPSWRRSRVFSGPLRSVRRPSVPILALARSASF
jgi:hypothetical protein